MTQEEIAARLAGVAVRPRTLLLDAPGGACVHAETIAQAGGTPCPALADQPEVLLLALPGKTLDEAEEEAYDLAETPGWFELPCVRGGECYLIDAARLAESETQALWIIATILHPDVFTEILPTFSVRMFPLALYRQSDDADR